MDELRFFNPYSEIRETANRLPHWQQKGAILPFDLLTLSQNLCARNGKAIVPFGFASTQSHGIVRRSENITYAFLARLNLGSMQVMDHVSCDEQTVRL